MKFNEKKKLWYGFIKSLSNERNWKFKNYFIFEKFGNLLFSTSFYVSMKEDAILIYSSYKPKDIDDTFWKIIGLESNIKKPLSFRINAAFQISSITFFKENFYIKDALNPQLEIENILKAVENVTSDKLNEIDRNQNIFLSELRKNEDDNCVEIVCYLIHTKQLENAKQEINKFKNNGFNPIFYFGESDLYFFDLALDYINQL
jgi:hypothetical protein